jgi:uncharacterized protein YdhG (YjbR/CyaY superfamily)
VSEKPRTIDDYLARLSPDKRTSLERLRRAVKAAAPKIEECISYGIPAFRLGGRVLVFMGAATNHCAFYPGARPIETHRADLAGYDISKGTVRFRPDDPLPATLVRKLVRTRISEHAAARPIAAHRTTRRRESR